MPGRRNADFTTSVPGTAPLSSESILSGFNTSPLPTIPPTFIANLSVPETPLKGNNPTPNSTEKSSLLMSTTPQTTNLSRQNTHQNANLKHSAQATTYLSKRTPLNTERSSQSFLRVFCRFIATHYCDVNPNSIEFNCLCPQHVFCNHVTVYFLVRRLVFSDDQFGYLEAGLPDLTTDQLQRIRYFLIEFVVNYKSTKTGKEVKPSTMKSYLMGLQRSFLEYWGYDLKIFEGSVFACPKNGLLEVVDNRFSAQQAQGQVTMSDNTLSRQDLENLLTILSKA